MWTDNLQNQ